MSLRHQSGFTLIELMIAMAIIAILTTAGLSAYTGYLKTGRDSVRGTLASQVNTEVMNYAGGHGGKPPASPEEFRQFIQSAGASFGRSAAEISNNTIIQDPLGGKEVCLDANGNANQPCAFHYTAYADGTYAISYGVEDPSSMKTNFYKTTASIPDPVTHTTPVTKYGVYIGTAPYIGGPATTANAGPAVDVASGVVRSFMSPRIDIVTVSGGSGGSGSGGGPNCDITICSVGQGCVGDICVDPCGDAETFCAEGETCTDGECVMPIPTCGDGLTIGGYATVIAQDDKCWLATNLPGHYQWMRKYQVSSSPWPSEWTGGDSTDPDYGDPCRVVGDGSARMPTKDEWATLVSREGITNLATASSSTLGLSADGYLSNSIGQLYVNNTRGLYWSSSYDPYFAYDLNFDSTTANPFHLYIQAAGLSVRCIVD